MAEHETLEDTHDAWVVRDIARLIEAHVPEAERVIFYGSKVKKKDENGGYGKGDIDLCVTHRRAEDDFMTFQKVIEVVSQAGYSTGFSELGAIHIETIPDTCYQHPELLFEKARIPWVEEVKRTGIVVFERQAQTSPTRPSL